MKRLPGTFPLKPISKVLSALMLALAFQTISAQTFPPNFAGVQLATGLDPVGMDVAADGRIFLAEKNGKVRVIKNEVLLSAPFAVIPNVDNWNERGLLKVLLDPDFSSNNYVYFYYTYKPSGSSLSNNRVSRFTASGDTALAGSELVLIDIDPLGSVGYHNGGGLAIINGRLFISVGENTVASNAQSLGTLKGKVLRINTDGSIPTDNPFYTTATGKNRAIWALGLRNPFRLAVQPGTGKLFANDVGAGSWEEINEVKAGSNYGWPGIEGVRNTETMPENYKDPFYAYGHGSGCSITAGAFYNPTTAKFPTSYVGKYFFGDYCNGWLKTIDPSTKAIADFATGIDRPLDVATGNDGTLYFIARGGIPGGSDDANTSSTSGVLWKVNYTGNGIPVIAVQPTSKTVSAKQPVTFSTVASGNPTPGFQWQRNGSNISGANSSSYTIASPALTDSGAKFKVIVKNTAGSVTSKQVTLTVINNQLPKATINSPVTGTKYSGGDVISFAGTGTDAEDGTLPASAFTWKIDLYHFDTPSHTHPAMDAKKGVRSGIFTVPVEMETSANVFFRIFLTVVDSKGAPTTTSVDVKPVTSTITMATSPAGLLLKLDGKSAVAPFSFVGVSRIQREIEAVSPQSLNGITYTFSSWSDSGAKVHTLSTPGATKTLTAKFVKGPIIADGSIYQLEPQSATGQRLDVWGNSTSDQAIVGIYNSNSGYNQRWKFIYKGNNLYELEPQHAPGKRLDVTGSSNADNAPIQTYSATGNTNQLWKLMDKGSGIYELEAQCAIGKRLDTAWINYIPRAVIKSANSSNSQRWKLITVPSSRSSRQDNTVSKTALLLNYPNSFAYETTIVFKKPAGSKQAFIKVYNQLGSLVRSLDVSTNIAGKVRFNAKDLPAGQYFYNLVADGSSLATKGFLIVR